MNEEIQKIAIDNIVNIQQKIVSKQISELSQVKKEFLVLKKSLIEKVESQKELSNELKEKITKNINEIIEKFYAISYENFKNLYWGEFHKLNKSIYPELCEILIDGSGDLRRVFDNFPVTLAMMDFHGYTKFSNEIKYNKTPLMEFGEGLPQKIQEICKKNRSFVYEIEGDSLIIIGPENPYYVLTACISIMELAKQQTLFKESNPKSFYGIEIKNPLIKKFEMNAAITTGGEAYINNKGNIIGTIIAEASRILKVLNIKKPNKSGIMINDKVFKNLEKFNNDPSYVPINLDNFSNPYLIDVKGLRLKVREFFFDNKPYLKMCDYYASEINNLLKQSTPAKWYNIIINYSKIVTEVLKYQNIKIMYNGFEYKSDGIIYLIEENLVRWINRPTPDVAENLLNVISSVYKQSEDVVDLISIYYEYINDNFGLIISQFKKFYESALDTEKKNNPKFKQILDAYNVEIDKIKTRYFPRRIFETVLANNEFLNSATDVPYIGKK